ncbi:TPA: DUF2207 domain-containing protein [Candidatus Avigastranaerophilus faecigallinarum]|nr:DUF2207 domain-containing protein [Candidatus Avigastranaerophilus faecigallinarum]
MKKVVLLFIAIFVNILFSLCANAENYCITNYDVDLNVHKNRTVDVTEKIDVFFLAPSKEFKRVFPIKPQFFYNNLQKKNQNVVISDIQINEPYTLQQTNDAIILKIEDSSKILMGPKNYQIKYKYKMGDDFLKASDEFYFNIIDRNWNTTIDNIKFRIKLPVPYLYLLQTATFSLGRIDSDGYNTRELNYFVEQNKIITGKVNRILSPKEGLSVRILLPNSYFVKEIKFIDKNFIFLFISILTIIAFLMWFIFGRDKKIIPIINCYPPKNKNSAEIGVEYKGVASSKEIVSLVLYLANKGYIEIEDDGISFSIRKLKDYEGQNSYEKRLMSALFKNSDFVTLEDLQYSKSFYRNCVAIISSLNNIKKYIFDKTANSFEKLFILVVCILGIFASIVYILGDYSLSLLFSPDAFLLLFPVVGIMVVLTFLYQLILSNETHIEKLKKLMFIIFWGSMFIGIPTILLLYKIYNAFIQNIIILFYAMVCLFISVICLFNMPKRNKQGIMLLAQIEGFKKFLEVAEKSKIEFLIAENRNYTSDVIPFAYVLNIADKIIPLFENLSLYSQPVWYRGKMSGYSFLLFVSKMEKVLEPSVENGGITRNSGSIYKR